MEQLTNIGQTDQYNYKLKKIVTFKAYVYMKTSTDPTIVIALQSDLIIIEAFIFYEYRKCGIS